MSENGTFSDDSWRDLPLVNPNDEWDFAAADGSRTLYAWFRDAAQNASARTQATTFVDLNDPTPTSAALEGWSYVDRSAGADPVDTLQADDILTVLPQVTVQASAGAVTW